MDVLTLAQTTVMSHRQAQVYVWVLEAIQKLGNYEDALMEDMSRSILGMAAVTGDSPVTSAFEMHDFIKGAIESGWWEKH